MSSTSRRFKAVVDRFIFDEYETSVQALGLFRIVYALAILLVFGVVRVDWVAGQPDLMFKPPHWSLVRFLMDAFPSPLFLSVLHGVLVALYVALLFGYRTRWVSLGIGLLVILSLNLTFSYGKIGHDQVFIYWLPLIMAFSNWGAAYSIDAKREGRPRASASTGWPLAMLALMFGFAMLTACLPKIGTDWLNPNTHAVRSHLLHLFYFLEKRYLLMELFVGVEASWFWEGTDWGGVLLELIAPICILRRRWFRSYLAVCVFFHLLNALILGITSFYANLFFYLLFLDFEWWVPRVSQFRLERYFTVPVFAAVAAVIVVYYQLVLESPYHALLGMVGIAEHYREFFVIVVALGIAVYSITITWRRVWQETPRARAQGSDGYQPGIF